MDLGPVEMIVVAFPGNRFTGEVVPALQDLIDRGLIRVIDLVFVTKDADGTVAAVELSDVDPDLRAAFDPVVAELTGLVSEEDVEDLGEALDPDSSAAVLLFEHVWAGRFAEAVEGSGGELAFSMRIPRDVVAELTSA